MIKLFKRIEGSLQYHEAWVSDGKVIEHWGRVGERGTQREHKLVRDQTADAALEDALRKARKSGFALVDDSDLATLLIEYAVLGMGRAQDIEKRHALEERMDQTLGWTGLGHCDGGSIGSGTMEVCCNAMHEHVTVAVEGEETHGVEHVPARNLGNGKWLLVHSPTYALQLAAGDTVKITDEEAGTFEIIARGGNVAVHFYLAEDEADNVGATEVIANRIGPHIGALGGIKDGQTAGLIVYTIPVSVGFAAIEKVFEAAVVQFPGAQWQYTNVYDPKTGEPLRWWE